MEHGRVACHEREFAMREVRETGCFKPNEPSNERTPSRSSNDTEASKARAAGWCRSRPANAARRRAPRTADEPNQWLDGAALKHNLDASVRRASTDRTELGKAGTKP